MLLYCHVLLLAKYLQPNTFFQRNIKNAQFSSFKVSVVSTVTARHEATSRIARLKEIEITINRRLIIDTTLVIFLPILELLRLYTKIVPLNIERYYIFHVYNLFFNCHMELA